MMPHTMRTQNCVQIRAPWVQRFSPHCQLNQRFLPKKPWPSGITHLETMRRPRLQTSFGTLVDSVVVTLGFLALSGLLNCCFFFKKNAKGTGTTEPVQRSRLKIARVQTPASEGVDKSSEEEGPSLAQRDIDEDSDIEITFDNDSTDGRTLVKVKANLDESSTLRQLLMTCWSSLRIK